MVVGVGMCARTELFKQIDCIFMENFRLVNIFGKLEAPCYYYITNFSISLQLRFSGKNSISSAARIIGISFNE